MSRSRCIICDQMHWRAYLQYACVYCTFDGLAYIIICTNETAAAVFAAHTLPIQVHCCFLTKDYIFYYYIIMIIIAITIIIITDCAYGRVVVLPIFVGDIQKLYVANFQSEVSSPSTLLLLGIIILLNAFRVIVYISYKTVLTIREWKAYFNVIS